MTTISYLITTYTDIITNQTMLLSTTKNFLKSKNFRIWCKTSKKDFTYTKQLCVFISYFKNDREMLHKNVWAIINIIIDTITLHQQNIIDI